MEIIYAIILGIVQGITEWFPVSSSGHLVLLQEVFSIDADLLFDVFLHLGSLFVLIIYFWKDILKILKSIVFFDTKSTDFKLAIYIIVGSIPAAMVGLFFHDLLARLFQNLFAVGIAFMITGVVIFLTKYRNLNASLNIKSSLLIGIAQAIAIIPGISRSGSTISVGILLGVKKEDIIKFSFLLAIPAIVGANLLEFRMAPQIELLPLLWGFIASFIAGYLTLSLLINIIKKGRFHYFSLYCWAIGLIAIFLSLW